MGDVFISHVEEDAQIALAIARGLNSADYSTWCYEEDSDPGVSYLKQIGDAVERSQAVVLVISRESLGSDQVTREVEFSHERRKPFIPVLQGISHAQFQELRVSWRVALGTTSTIPIPAEGVSAILPRIVRGLQELGVKPSAILAAERAEEERLAAEKAESARKAGEQARAETLAREKAEAERRAAEQAELERRIQEHLSLGVDLHENGNLEGAISEYREALSLEPGNVDAHYNLADALDAKHDLEGAISEYREVLRLQPNDAEVHNKLGNALSAKHDFEGAVDAYRAALRLKPDLHPEIRQVVNDIVGPISRKKSYIFGSVFVFGLLAIPLGIFWSVFWSVPPPSSVPPELDFGGVIACSIASILGWGIWTFVFSLSGDLLTRRWGVRLFEKSFPETSAERPIALSILLEMKTEQKLFEAIQKRAGGRSLR